LHKRQTQKTIKQDSQKKKLNDETKKKKQWKKNSSQLGIGITTHKEK
jgi:hypothetical protein